MARSKDHLDHMLDQWRHERPEIDADGMAIVPRLMRLAHLYESRMRSVSRGLGLKPGWLDALSALRRSGPPYRLTASELAQSILLSSGGMTSRIDRMEETGLIKRVRHPSDRRVVFVELTERGRKTIDVAIDAHLDLYEDLLSSLTKAEQKTFIDLMRKQTLALEPQPD